MPTSVRVLKSGVTSKEEGQWKAGGWPRSAIRKEKSVTKKVVLDIETIPDADTAARAGFEETDGWRRDYNEVRPHSAIDNKPPISLLSAPVAHGSP